VADHVSLTNHVRVAAMSGVTKSISHPGDYGGMPAQPIAQWRRQVASARRAAAAEQDGAARNASPPFQDDFAKRMKREIYVNCLLFGVLLETVLHVARLS